MPRASGVFLCLITLLIKNGAKLPSRLLLFLGYSAPLPQSSHAAAQLLFLDELGQNHDALTFHAAFNVARIVRHQ